MRLRDVGIILVLIVMASSFGQTPSETGVQGVVTISPTRPGPVRVDEAGSAPLANFPLGAANEKGTVASFTTDAQGRFRIALPPGHYTISPGRKIGIRGCGPFDVDVVAGKMTTVEWECDTGMR